VCGDVFRGAGLFGWPRHGARCRLLACLASAEAYLAAFARLAASRAARSITSATVRDWLI